MEKSLRELSPAFCSNRRRFLGAFLAGSAAVAASSTGRVSGSVPASGIGGRGMQVALTGSGSALIDPQRGNASQAVAIDGSILQFDCGRRAMDNLALVGVNPTRVDFLFFTHLHFDHIATYGYFVVSTWIAGRRKPIRVFGPRGTLEMSKGALEAVHGTDRRFIKNLIASWPDPKNPPPVDEPPVEIKVAEPGRVLETEKFRVSAVSTPHYRSMGVESLAYRVDSKYGSVVISGDTAPSEEVVRLARGTDLLIHECVIPDPGMTGGGKFNAKNAKAPEGHTTPSQLGRLAQEAGVKKVVATHLPPYTSVPAAVEMSRKYYGTGTGPEVWAEFASAIRKNFDGQVILAEDALVIQVGAQ